MTRPYDDVILGRTTPRAKRDDPLISIFCRCGAQWHSAHAINNVVVSDHLARCGSPLTAAEFIANGYAIWWPHHWTDDDRRAAIFAASVIASST